MHKDTIKQLEQNGRNSLITSHDFVINHQRSVCDHYSRTTKPMSPLSSPTLRSRGLVTAAELTNVMSEDKLSTEDLLKSTGNLKAGRIRSALVSNRYNRGKPKDVDKAKENIIKSNFIALDVELDSEEGEPINDREVMLQSLGANSGVGSSLKVNKNTLGTHRRNQTVVASHNSLVKGAELDSPNNIKQKKPSMCEQLSETFSEHFNLSHTRRQLRQLKEKQSLLKQGKLAPTPKRENLLTTLLNRDR